MRTVGGGLISFVAGFLLAAAIPVIDGRLTGAWVGDFALYVLGLVGIGAVGGLLRVRTPALLAAAAVGQAVAWYVFVPADPLWPLGLLVGLVLTVLATGGGAYAVRRVIGR